MGGRDERHARSQAGAQDADPAVALLLPASRGRRARRSRIAGRHGSCGPRCSTHDSRRAAVSARLALGMIRHGHAQRADAEAVEQLRQTHMPVRARIPLRQDDTTRPWSFWPPGTTARARCCFPDSRVCTGLVKVRRFPVSAGSRAPVHRRRSGRNRPALRSRIGRQASAELPLASAGQAGNPRLFSQSVPHSNGRTTRFVSRVASLRSHRSIHRA